jgi:hypothetical protein
MLGSAAQSAIETPVEMAAGDPAPILNPTPIFFTACWGAFFYYSPRLPPNPENPPHRQPKISLIPCAFRLCQYIPVYVSGLSSNIHLGFGSSSFFVFLHLFSVFLFFFVLAFGLYLSVFVFQSLSLSFIVNSFYP